MIKHDVFPDESEYLLTEEDPVASTTPDSAEAEAATEAVLSVEDIAANLVEEEPRLVLEQDKEVTLRITRLTAGNEISQLSENYQPNIVNFREIMLPPLPGSPTRWWCSARRAPSSGWAARRPRRWTATSATCGPGTGGSSTPPPPTPPSRLTTTVNDT